MVDENFPFALMNFQSKTLLRFDLKDHLYFCHRNQRYTEQHLRSL